MANFSHLLPPPDDETVQQLAVELMSSPGGYTRDRLIRAIQHYNRCGSVTGAIAGINREDQEGSSA